MKPTNSNLNEDLGRIEFIFSDKTGTVTQNTMVLSKWFVNGKIYHEADSPGSLVEEDRSFATEPISSFVKAIGLCNTVQLPVPFLN